MLCDVADDFIVICNAFDELVILVFNCFASLDNANIFIPKVRNRTDDGFRLLGPISQYDNFVFRVICYGTHNVDVQGLENLFGGIQKGGGIVVSRNDDNVPAAGTGDCAEKVVVKLLSAVAGGARVKNISGDKQCIDIFGFDSCAEPV